MMTRNKRPNYPETAGDSPPLIHTFSIHCRDFFGEPIGKIAIDTGQICPNRLSGGCIYCSPTSFTPKYLLQKGPVEAQIKRGKARLVANGFKRYFAYFQQETSTAMETDALMGIISIINTDPRCVGLILSTRPDYVGNRLLDRLAELMAPTGKRCLFELGLQSVHDSSLKLLNRNHTFTDFTDTVYRIKSAGVFELGAHLIFGIPGETKEDMLASLQTVCNLEVDCLKLHHLQVIRGTVLHQMYERGEVEVFSRDEYTELLLEALPIIPDNIVIHRLWASSHPEMLVAPQWGILATHLSRELRQKMEKRGIRQGAQLLNK